MKPLSTQASEAILRGLMMFRLDGWAADTILYPTMKPEHHQTDSIALKMSPIGGILIVSNFFYSCLLLRETVCRSPVGWEVRPSLLAQYIMYIRVNRMYICTCSIGSTATYGNVFELSPSHTADPEQKIPSIDIRN